jgi:type IV pilus assembly protein PilC
VEVIMSCFSYVAVDLKGTETRGVLEVPDQLEAIRRIKEMGLFPTRLLAEKPAPGPSLPPRARRPALSQTRPRPFRWRAGIKPAVLAVFTRQLATLLEAGMPLLRSLRTLREQQPHRRFRLILAEIESAIENGSSLAEALAAHPQAFNRLYVYMVRAGELAGALEITLRRLAEFMEKARRIKGKVKAAMFYPCAVLTVASAILALLMAFVVPRFKLVFDGLLGGAPLPTFTTFVFNLSTAVQTHFLAGLALVAVLAGTLPLALRTTAGRWVFDQLKLTLPVLGPLFRKVAISRFARTLGTLVNSGVPILQALAIVKETTGNVVYARIIGKVHDQVKAGDPIAPTLKASALFPTMVAGMVDVGEQTGALPDLLMKIADTYDEEVDNAASALTSLLEPILIVCLALIVGSIVVAMYLPILHAPALIDPSNASGPAD